MTEQCLSTAALSRMNLWTHRFFPQDTVSVSPHRRVSHSSAPKVSSDSYTVFRLLFIHFTLHVVLALLWLLGVLFMLCVSVWSVCVCVCVFVELGGAFISQHALWRIRISAEGRLIRRRVRQKAASRCMNTHESSFYKLVSDQMSHLMRQNKLKWCLEIFKYLKTTIHAQKLKTYRYNTILPLDCIDQSPSRSRTIGFIMWNKTKCHTNIQFLRWWKEPHAEGSKVKPKGQIRNVFLDPGLRSGVLWLSVGEESVIYCSCC